MNPSTGVTARGESKPLRVDRRGRVSLSPWIYVLGIVIAIELAMITFLLYNSATF